MADGSAFLTVRSTAPLFSDSPPTPSSTACTRSTAPAGATCCSPAPRKSTATASTAITSRLPLVLGLIAVIMFAVLFLLTGSVVMPLKALCSTCFR